MDILFHRRRLINHAVQPALTRMGVADDPEYVWKLMPNDFISTFPAGKWIKREFSVNVRPNTEDLYVVAIQDTVHQHMTRDEFEQFMQRTVKYMHHNAKRQHIRDGEWNRFVVLTKRFTNIEDLPTYQWLLDLHGGWPETSVTTFQTKVGPRVLALSGSDNRVLILSSTIRSHYAAYAKWAETCCAHEVIYG